MSNDKWSKVLLDFIILFSLKHFSIGTRKALHRFGNTKSFYERWLIVFPFPFTIQILRTFNFPFLSSFFWDLPIQYEQKTIRSEARLQNYQFLFPKANLQHSRCHSKASLLLCFQPNWSHFSLPTISKENIVSFSKKIGTDNSALLRANW